MSNVERLVDLAGTVRRLREVSYVDVAALTYILIDYAQTTEWEIKHMWGGKPSMIKLFYFIGRYLGILDFPLMFIYSHYVHNLTPGACTLIYSLGGASALTGASAAEALMFLRVWVLSGCTRKMAWFLSVQFTIIMLIVTALAGLYLKSLIYTISPLPDHIACYQLSGDRSKLALMYSFVLIHQVVVMMLCLYFGVATFRHSRSPLLYILYRDGTFYFAILSAVSIANIGVITAGPPEYQNLFLLLQRTIHSTLATRTILKMREMAGQKLIFLPTTTAANATVGIEVEVLHAQNPHQTVSFPNFRYRAQQWISEGLVTTERPENAVSDIDKQEDREDDYSDIHSVQCEGENPKNRL